MFFANEEAGGKGAGVGVEWYKLQRGAGELLKSTWGWAQQGVLLEMLECWSSMELDDTIPLEPKEECNFNALATCWPLSDLSDEEKLILDETLQSLHLLFSIISTKSHQTNMKIARFRATFAWTAPMPHGFCAMLEKRVPQAIVLIAVYCVLCSGWMGSGG